MCSPNQQGGETDFMVGGARSRLSGESGIEGTRDPSRHRIGIPIHERRESEEGFGEAAENGGGAPGYGLIERQRFAPAFGKQRKKRPKEINPHGMPHSDYK